MIFQVGKVYNGYEVESRTACFVTFKGEKRRKIEVFEGLETAPVYTYPNGIERIVDVTANEDTQEPEKFFIPVVAVYDNRDCHNTPANHAHAMATPYIAPTVDFDEVEATAATLGYKIVNLSTKKNKPMYRLMRDGAMIPSREYGSGCCLFDVRAYLEREQYANRRNIEVPSAVQTQYSREMGCNVQVVVRDIKECHYAIACQIATIEPSWFYSKDDESCRIELERERAQKMWDRDEMRERVEFAPYSYDLMRY
jgi:hypothetical protein